MKTWAKPLLILGLELAAIGVILELIQRRPIFDPSILPLPSTVIKTFLALLGNGNLLQATAWSLLRVSIGYSLAVLVGIPLGILIGRFSLVEASIGTWINLVRPIPAMAWIPIAILWFGIGMKSSSFLIFYGALFPMVINAAGGVRNIDRIYIDSVRASGGTVWDVFREVIIPGAMPAIMTGMRIALGVAWIVVVAAEMFGATTGLGYMINAGQTTYRVDYVLVGIAIIGLVGFGLDIGFRRVESWVLSWRA